VQIRKSSQYNAINHQATRGFCRLTSAEDLRMRVPPAEISNLRAQLTDRQSFENSTNSDTVLLLR